MFRELAPETQRLAKKNRLIGERRTINYYVIYEEYGPGPADEWLSRCRKRSGGGITVYYPTWASVAFNKLSHTKQ